MGTHLELEKNMLGTKEKWKKSSSPPSPPPHPAFPLAAWNFYFQNCSSPFLAWANTHNINWGYLFIYLA
jgi:hypothetical protein